MSKMDVVGKDGWKEVHVGQISTKLENWYVIAGTARVPEHAKDIILEDQRWS